MDERLYNLMRETGHFEDYYFETDDPRLEDKLLGAIEKMWAQRERVREEILTTISTYLKMVAEMGATFRNFVRENFPEFPLAAEPKDRLGYLPPVYPELSKVIGTVEKAGNDA